MDTKTWRQTYTGGAFDLLSPRAEDVSIQDIAHSLSNLCRYNGHSLRHYSVAEHSVLVATYAQAVLHKSPVEILHALLHDAGEAYTGDIATPMKEAVPALRPFLKKIDAVVLGAFGLPPEKPEWLDEVDREGPLRQRPDGVGIEAMNGAGDESTDLPSSSAPGYLPQGVDGRHGGDRVALVVDGLHQRLKHVRRRSSVADGGGGDEHDLGSQEHRSQDGRRAPHAIECGVDRVGRSRRTS